MHTDGAIEPQPTFVAERITVAGGLTLNVLSCGSGVPAIVLLHGLGDCGCVWRPFIRAMRSRAGIVALDLPGHGDSEYLAVGRDAVPRIAATIAEALDHLRLRSIVLVGHSLGAQVAIYLASHGAHATGLVLIEGGPYTITTSGAAIREVLRSAHQKFGSIDDYLRVLQARLPLVDRSVLAELAPEMVFAAADGSFHLKCRPEVVDSFKSASDESLAGWLEHIACPSLVVRGAWSSVVPKPAVHKMLKHLRSGALAEVRAAGHCVVLENPAGLAAAVYRFLDQVPEMHAT